MSDFHARIEVWWRKCIYLSKFTADLCVKIYPEIVDLHLLKNCFCLQLNESKILDSHS